jgi:hypothetical protein
VLQVKYFGEHCGAAVLLAEWAPAPGYRSAYQFVAMASLELQAQEEEEVVDDASNLRYDLA